MSLEYPINGQACHIDLVIKRREREGGREEGGSEIMQKMGGAKEALTQRKPLFPGRNCMPLPPQRRRQRKKDVFCCSLKQ